MKKVALLMISLLAACDIEGGTGTINDPSAPSNLNFQLTPSGDPNVPLGILLSWDPPSNGRAMVFDIYGRSNSTGWILRASTTSNTFHDAGIPQSQYYVVALDEQSAEMGRTNTITVDLTTRLPAPLGLASVSLNAGIHLRWDDNAVHSTLGVFDHYRVYSSTYSNAKSACEAPWYFEGSTVSDAFLIGNLTNGETRCYAVSAISVDGRESTWSSARMDTPRSDAQSAVAYSAEFKADSGAFVFNDEVAGKLGITTTVNRTDADFSLSRHGDGTLWISPARTGVQVRLYQATTVADLRAIDRAPPSGYATSALQVVPGLAYVFQIQENDGVHYAVLRPQFATADMMVFDWAYQDAAGNAELSRGVKR